MEDSGGMDTCVVYFIKIPHKHDFRDQKREEDHETNGARKSGKTVLTPAANSRAMCSRQGQMAGRVTSVKSDGDFSDFVRF